MTVNQILLIENKAEEDLAGTSTIEAPHADQNSKMAAVAQEEDVLWHQLKLKIDPAPTEEGKILKMKVC